MYIKRDSEYLLKKFAQKYPVVTITGSRQSGKTTLCKQAFPNKKYISLEDIDTRDFALNDPRGFLSQYSNGVIIDEIQRVPDLLSYIQGIVDKNEQKGEFILTGSSQFNLSNSISQSLAGRTALLKLYPFSFSEIYDKCELSRDWINQILYKGFYPRIFNDNLNPTDALSAYIETYVEKDVRQFSEIKNLSKFRTFLRLTASRVGQLLNYSSISNDLGISVPTIKNWISILEQSYIIYLLPPFHANIRKRLVKTPKLFFYDTGLCAFLNGAKKAEHIDILPNRGSLFENFVISEFFKMNAHNNIKDDFYFFRDKRGNEVDLLIDEGVKTIPLEIKSSLSFNKNFFTNLKYFSQLKINSEKGSVIFSGENQLRSDFKVYNFKNYFDEYLKRS